MSTNKKINKPTLELIKALESDDEKALLKTLEKLEENGNENLIEPIIKLGIRRQEVDIQEAIKKILFSLKISSAHPIVLSELKTMKPSPFRQILLSAVWESNINGLEELDTFVRIALEGNLYEAIECLTVIEESEGELVEEKILDSLLLLKQYYSTPESKTDVKATIIQSIMDTVTNMNKGLR